MTEITSAGRQLAADLANAEEINAMWKPSHFGNEYSGVNLALARLATQSIARDAELAEAKADLRGIAELCLKNPNNGTVHCINVIAAKHRETDLLVEALKAANLQICSGEEEYAPLLRAELAKRGIELP